MLNRKENQKILKQEDSNLLADNFLNNYWEIDLVSIQNSWIDDSFWKELGFFYSPKTGSNKDWVSMILKEDLEDLLEECQLLCTEVQLKKIVKVIRLQPSAKEIVWMQLNGIVTKTEEGKIRVFGSAINVSNTQKENIKLKQELEYSNNVIEIGDVAAWQYDFRTELIVINQRYAGLVGYTVEELQPLTKDFWKTFVHPEDSELITGIMKNLVTNHEPFNVEYRLRHKDGSWVWVVSKGGVTKKASDNSLAIMSGCLFDITERKKNELLLLDFTNIMKRINEVAKIGKWEVAINNNELSKNMDTIIDDAIRMFMGSSKDYVPDFENLYDVIQEGKERDAFLEKVTLAIEKGIEYDVVLPLITQPNNIIKWARVIGIPEFKNNQCCRLYGFFQDINEETSISKELKEKEEQLRFNFNQAAVGMAVIGLNGKMIKVNDEISNITGYCEEEMLGFSFGDLGHPEDQEKGKKLLHSVLTGKKDSVQAEIRCIHKKGYVVWISTIISAVKNNDGEIIHLFSQHQDISEKKALTESLKEHNNRLLNFAHIVSHNLRSHASNISMLLNLVFKEYPKIMENQFLKSIRTVSDNMNDTIYDLNEIVELSSNINTKLTAQNLKLCLKKSIQNINSLIKDADAHIDIDVDSNIEVLAINAYLESILLNLLTNAVKYRMPSRSLKISIKAKVLWENVIFTIEDNGLGIDLDKNKEKLFGLYKTFHEHDDSKGVGLFIVKNQIEAMGGRIEVASKVKQGTEFKVYFKKA